MSTNYWTDELDIVNSDKWSKEHWLSYFQDRLNDMRAKREPFENMWKRYENQIEAKSFYDNEWELQVNVPLEKDLKEIYMWRTEWKVNFDIVPDEQADIEELQPSKYALNFFLDWDKKDNFWKENRYLRDIKSTYGDCIRYTWIRSYKDINHRLKEWEKIISNSDLQDRNKFEKVENETWFFFPKALHPNDVYWDDKAYWQDDAQYCEDVIYKEKITRMELEMRYWDNDLYDIENISYWNDIDPKNKNDVWVQLRQIVIYHYFHRRTKTYLIVANEENVIHEWLYFYEDWKLPFVNVQHYLRTDRIRGEWIPERIAYLKAYKSEILQDILAWSAMSSWIHVLAWNDEQIWQDWTLWGRKMNLWRTTWGVDQFKQVNTSPNLWYFTTVLNLIDRLITIDSWINPAETIDPLSDKVWIVEIMEANKAVRNRSVDENYNIALDEALTMMLDRIKNFAPALLMEEIKNEDWKILKTIFPKIRIDDYEVKKEKGKQTFTENIGKFGYFELKPWLVQWLWVKIITPSTNSSLPILERQKFTEYINNIMTLAQVAQVDQTWEAMEKLRNNINFDDIILAMNDAYGYDVNWIKAYTEKDKIYKENTAKLEATKEMLLAKQPTNETIWQDIQETAWMETQNQWVWQAQQGKQWAFAWQPTI